MARLAAVSRTACTFSTPGTRATCGLPALTSSETTIGPVTFRIELCAKHAEQAAQVLLSVGGAPSVSARAAVPPRRAASGRQFDTGDVRAWLREQGECVGQRGRLAERDYKRYAEDH